MGVAWQFRKCLEDALDYRHSKEEAQASGSYFKTDRGMEHRGQRSGVIAAVVPHIAHSFLTDTDVAVGVNQSGSYVFSGRIIAGFSLRQDAGAPVCSYEVQPGGEPQVCQTRLCFPYGRIYDNERILNQIFCRKRRLPRSPWFCAAIWDMETGREVL